MTATRTNLLCGTMLDRLGHAGLTAAGLLYAAPAWAAGSSMPWEAPLEKILQSIEGPVAKIIAAYHAELPELAGVRSFPESAAKQLRKRWREDVERQSVAWWAEFFRYVKSCDYLVGKVNGFEADLIWLVGPRNFAKVLNGNYENRGRA